MDDSVRPNHLDALDQHADAPATAEGGRPTVARRAHRDRSAELGVIVGPHGERARPTTTPGPTPRTPPA